MFNEVNDKLESISWEGGSLKSDINDLKKEKEKKKVK